MEVDKPSGGGGRPRLKGLSTSIKQTVINAMLDTFIVKYYKVDVVKFTFISYITLY